MQPMKDLSRKIGGLGPAIIFLAALAYRVAYFLTVRDDPLMTYVDAIPDASLYHNWAVKLIGGAPPRPASFVQRIFTIYP